MYLCHANHNGKDGRLITVCQCLFPDLAFMKDKGLAHFAGNLGFPDLVGEELVRSQWWIQDLQNKIMELVVFTTTHLCNYQNHKMGGGQK